MEWVSSIKFTIDYIERNLLSVSGAEEIAKPVCISPFYLQTGFKMMTGYSIGEYIRNRRLYLAALDVCADKEKIIDLAYKYGYDTPESFSKAFSRFHGFSPTQIKKDPHKLKVFLPLRISISIKGGYNMDYTVEKMEGFKVIGFEREFTYENAYAEIPKFWDELSEKYFSHLWGGRAPDDDIEETICNCCIGEFGVNIDDIGNGKFRYIIAGTYTEGEVPEGMTVYELPDVEWAKFLCKGAMPTALQSINTKIFKEWLPGNPDYEIAVGVNIEWYSDGDTHSSDYESAIWIPVKRKK